MLRKMMPGVTLVAVLALVVTVFASGSSAGNGKAGSRYPGTLTATPKVLHAGDYFDVSGCGYGTSLGMVIVSFAGASYASSLDNGCFTITAIVALSGDSLAPGIYEVGAWQYVRTKLVETGETTVTVVA
jgi:hypothetical protein